MRANNDNRPETLLAIVDTAAADEVDVCGNPADSGSQLLLLGVIHLDDVPVDEHLPGVCAEVVRPQLAHFVLDEIQLLFVQADFLADGARAVWYIETLLSQYNGHFFVETQVSKQKIFKKYALPLLRKRERIVSADMRFERVASTSGVRTHRKMSGSALQPIRPF